MVAVPFFREFALKRLLHMLHLQVTLPGLERAENASVAVAKAELERFRPSDGAYVLWGLLVIAFSYLLHIIGEILEYLSH